MSDPKKETRPDTPASKKEVEAALASRKTASPYTMPANHPWAGLWKLFAALAVLGAAMGGVGFFQDKHRFAFSYLAAFAWGFTLCMGALFFVLLQHLTSAGWSVTVRRGAEQLMSVLPIFVGLFIPVILLRNELYPWLGEAAHHPAIAAKHGFLNFPFWAARTGIYFTIIIFLSTRLHGWSHEQDESGDPKLTVAMNKLSAPGMPLFALTLTFAGIDWFMTLDPEWYSTMFGVYLFAGSVISIMAFLVLFYSRLTAAKLLRDAVNAEHFHDIGKLMFAFTIFWAYIGFSQYFLIWYANIPEETLFFKHRQENGWGTISIFLVLGHFFFPFFLMLSRHAKRWQTPRSIGAAWILMMHFVDMYWLIMPNVDHHFHFMPWADLGCLFLVVGIVLAVALKRFAESPLVPVKDPRLARALSFENALGTTHGSPRRRSQKRNHPRHRRRLDGDHRRDDVRPRQLLRHPPRRRTAAEGVRTRQPRPARPAQAGRAAPGTERIRRRRRQEGSRPHPDRPRHHAARPARAGRHPVDSAGPFVAAHRPGGRCCAGGVRVGRARGLGLGGACRFGAACCILGRTGRVRACPQALNDTIP